MARSSAEAVISIACSPFHSIAAPVPLKSNRVAISRAVWPSALSTSCRSILLTMSNEESAMRCLRFRVCVVPRYSCVSSQPADEFRGDGPAGCPSGQWERTVNPSALPSKVRILHLPLVPHTDQVRGIRHFRMGADRPGRSPRMRPFGCGRSPSHRVPLHPAGVGAGPQRAVAVAAGRAEPAQRPRVLDGHVVAAAPQLGDGRLAPKPAAPTVATTLRRAGASAGQNRPPDMGRADQEARGPVRVTGPVDEVPASPPSPKCAPTGDRPRPAGAPPLSPRRRWVP